jgi:hypothetical protein
MNSGSYLIMQLLILALYFVRKFLHKLGVKYAKYPIFRRLGMMITPPNTEELKMAFLKLMLETYFDLAIGTFINIQAFIECQGLREFSQFFRTFTDFSCSAITIVMLVAIVTLPIWIFRLISKNRKDVHKEEFQDKYPWLFEELSVTGYDIALYQFYYLLRRVYLAFIVVFMPFRPVLHCLSFIALSLANLIYLLRHQPFKKFKETGIEIGNEICILSAYV